ncbi:hypothetical protein CLOM_g8967 [Closterium sp. NIES-68]|nr:hypothetical protein CLOM_g8967 [Closterium sp. NIES-68]
MHVIARPFCTLHPDHCHPPPPHPSHPPAAPHQVFAASPASAPECACEQQRVVTIAQQRFGPLGFASTVWDSSIVAGKYFERHAHLVRSKTCIELGAGCGLLGISLAVLGARAVVLTDMPGNLPLLHRNVHANDLHHTVHVKALTWGSAQDACALPTPAAAAAAEPPTLAQAPPTTPSTEPPRGNPSTKQPHSRAAAVPCASGGPPTFDLVVATDVVYDHGAIAPLVDTLAMLCGPRTSVFIAHGRNRQALAEFLRRVGERFRVREVAWEEMHETYRCEDVQMMELTLHQ